MFCGPGGDLPRRFARDRLADMTILITARLELRPITADDQDHLAALYADSDVMRYIGTGLPRTREETVGRLNIQRDHWRQHGFGFFMARRREDGIFVGRCGLQHLGDTGTVELGYTLAKEHWGFGYATEAARACVDYAFGTLRLDRITAIARPENAASRHVMEKLGMRFVKTGEWDGGPVVWYEMERPG
jgi:ribosomal-protein-alanine N-acetyltransferase